MKSIYILIATLFITNNIIGQHTFEKIISSDQDKTIYDIIEDDNNNYVIVGRVKNIDTEVYDGFIVKLDNTGNITNELQLSNGTKSSLFFNIHCIEDKYYIIGTQMISYPDTSKIWFVVINSDFSINEERLLNLPTGYWYSYMNSVIDSDSNIVIGGNTTRIDENIGYHFDPAFYKINLNGDSITSNFMFLTRKKRSSYDIIESRDNNTYRAFVSRFDNIHGGEELILNKEFDSIGIRNIPKGIYDNYSPIYLSDTNLLLCGNGSNTDSALYELAVITVNDQMQIIDYNHFKKDENMRDHTSFLNGSSKNGNSIYIGGTSNFDYYNPFYSHNSSWFHLVKLTTELDPIWEKWYGGDVYHSLYNILATSDGGCVMIGNRYDADYQYVRDIYVVKVDENGVISWTQNVDMLKNIFTVYPNPGYNHIIINNGGMILYFELFDIYGNLLIQKEIDSEINSVSTQQLSSGYFFL